MRTFFVENENAKAISCSNKTVGNINILLLVRKMLLEPTQMADEMVLHDFLFF